MGSIDWEHVRGVIVDLDGVITQTASLHARAWKQMFDEYLARRQERGEEKVKEFSIDADYPSYVDGRPRFDGVKSFLKTRGIELPWGQSGDRLEDETICGLGQRKNEIYLDLLEQEGPRVFNDSVEQLKNWKSRGMLTALVSSSRNSKKVLEKGHLSDLFVTCVDGNDLDSKALAGKPEPDMYLEAARRLGIDASEGLIIEDAEAGVVAGKRGKFRYVVGMDPEGRHQEALKRQGADLVVRSLKDIGLDETETHTTPLVDIFAHEAEVREKLRGRKMAVFLDYDGTLTPIVNRPQDAQLSVQMKSIIERLSAVCQVAVISGRDRQDVSSMVASDELIYAGSHGFDISGPHGLNYQVEEANEALPFLNEAERVLTEEASAHEGVWVERKKFAIAIHMRQAKSQESLNAMSEVVDQLVKRHPCLRRTEGKMIIELRPNIDWHKGRALAWLEDVLDLDKEKALSIYVGDDVTDEDAFAEVRDHGFGVLVSEDVRPTQATYWLKSVKEVERFLELVLDESQTSHSEMETSPWTLVYNIWKPEQQKLREAICTLGNGYFATRGAFAEVQAGSVHYPGTYLAGGYNRAESDVAERVIENEDLVNWPNWLSLRVRIEQDPWFDLDSVKIREFVQELNVKEGVLSRKVEFEDRQGRITCLNERRIVSMADPHTAAIQWTLTPKNWNGWVIVRSALDGSVKNEGVERYKSLTSEHFNLIEKGLAGELGIYLVAMSRQSHIIMAQGARTDVYLNGLSVNADRSTHQDKNSVYQELKVYCEKHKDLVIDKRVAIYSSRDFAVSDPATEVQKKARSTETFEDLLTSHKRSWAHLWNRCDIELSDSTYTQFVLRLHIFHLLQSASMNTIDLDVGVPARGWHGEAYRGHIFWDELFIFPFLNLRIPELTRSLLMYRYRRLPEARSMAKAHGYKGAMFPWQSGSDGRDESQIVHLNPQSGRWVPDHTHLQRHIGAAVAYNVWQYYESTRDIEFMSFYGAKVMLEVARFFSSLATYNSLRHRYDILGVVGPDEFHTHYPDSEDAGVDNNAYTNVMVAWTLEHALRSLNLLSEERQKELIDELELTDEEVHQWKHVSERLFIPFLENGVIAQFEGYDELKEFDWQTYESKYHDIQRLDRILGAEGDSPNNYKVSKQADVIMLFYLFSAEELQEIFNRLGYEFSPDCIPKNIDYYTRRVSHGSTLSRIVHAWVLARLDRPKAWSLFTEALNSDISDIQGGTTSEGIHLGAMAGTVDIIQRCFTGLEVRNEVLWFNPNLPEKLPSVHYRIRYQGHWLRVNITQDKLAVQFERSWFGPVRIGFQGQQYEMCQGDHKEFSLK